MADQSSEKATASGGGREVTADNTTEKDLQGNLKQTPKSDTSTSTEAGNEDPSDTATDLSNHECAVCLQQCVHPVKLPCSHIFCYLCVKGVANRSKKCALCRTNIPPEFVNKPQLVCKEDVLNSSALEDGTQWFYSGNNSGWWKYDSRTNKDIEDKYQEGVKKFDILIAGYLYVIDLEQMVQYRNRDISKKRNIKRDQEDKVPTKGVAGLVLKDDSVERESADGDGDTDSVATLPSTPTPVAVASTTVTPTADQRNNNNRAVMGFPSPIMHLSPHLVDTRRPSPAAQTASTPSLASVAGAGAVAGGNNDSFLARMRDVHLGDSNPSHYIPCRGSGNTPDSTSTTARRRRRRERESFANLRRINTDSEESD